MKLAHIQLGILHGVANNGLLGGFVSRKRLWFSLSLLVLIPLFFIFQNCGGFNSQPVSSSSDNSFLPPDLGGLGGTPTPTPDPNATPTPTPSPTATPVPTPTPLANLTNAWMSINTSGAPAGRSHHSAVWTGSKMIVWGGYDVVGAQAATVLNDGGIYDPASNTWTAIGTAGAPDARSDHMAVWTGSKMVIFGGGSPIASDAVNSLGGIYDPATGTWTAINSTGAPNLRMNATAIWTGTKMIVFGGFSRNPTTYQGVGAIFDPATNTWTAMSTNNAPGARALHTAIWTGTKMIVWGGNNGTAVSNGGGIYDPATNTWAGISTNNAPSARTRHSAIWTGAKMIIWGGCNLNCTTPLANGGIYDPATNTWTAISTTGAPVARADHNAQWTGLQMIVWGGRGPATLGDGGVYDFITNTWAPVSATNVPTPREFSTSVWTGSKMLIWGGYLDSNPFTYYNNGGILY